MRYKDFSFEDVCVFASEITQAAIKNHLSDDDYKKNIQNYLDSIRPDFDLTADYKYPDNPCAFELKPNNQETFQKIVESFEDYSEYYGWDIKHNKLVSIKPIEFPEIK